ncbi:casein kinase II subunit beta [Strigomonas culicis]|uniref:Casein kinase II subunit beta n=1 Tax=Strigomonas culicis TaxID=28005 RepID=S9W782_9TRYP|nr:casein kinase II subunit beta [Strigomonas culicis]|eukprot:EPY31840.1 casein kinase II subunit beta [Strigomonas culicis]
MDDDFTADMEGYEVDSEENMVSWITWFCELRGNEFFCNVDREFIADDFNLTGLSSMVPFYHYALELILDTESLDSDRLTDEQKRLVESSAETLYGLIHTRFIVTSRGLKLMEEKLLNGDFGTCPRVFCGGQPVLPVGQSDVVRESSVKLFCPKCEDIFYPRSTRHKSLDGAFWGTTFPHLLLLQMRENGLTIPKPTQHYVPRIYGFRIRKADLAPPIENSSSAATNTNVGANRAIEGEATGAADNNANNGTSHEKAAHTEAINKATEQAK